MNSTANWLLRVFVLVSLAMHGLAIWYFGDTLPKDVEKHIEVRLVPQAPMARARLPEPPPLQEPRADTMPAANQTTAQYAPPRLDPISVAPRQPMRAQLPCLPKDVPEIENLDPPVPTRWQPPAAAKKTATVPVATVRHQKIRRVTSRSGHRHGPGPMAKAAPKVAKGSASEMAAYLIKIRQRIERHKHYPRRARRRYQVGQVKVGFELTPKGLARQIRVLDTSGHGSLDKAACQAVATANPFPPPPPGFKNNYKLQIKILFQLN